MSEVHYLISDASRQVDVESHVLRYWEEELELDIPRNDMGHRYYTEYHIRLFRQIKDLKEKGYQLKAIKSALNKMSGVMEEITITEDYMEEDMKAAWNEGQVKERAGKEGPKRERPAVGQVRPAPWDTVKAAPENVAAAQIQEIPRAPKEAGEKTAGEKTAPKTGQASVSQLKPKPAAGGREVSGQASGQAQGQSQGQPSAVRPKEGGSEILKLRERDNGEKKGKTPGEVKAGQVEVVQPKGGVAEMNAEKMARFQSVMNHIIGRAMDANMDRLAREVSNTVSEDVTDKVMKEVEYLMRVSDEKEEERFRQLDETIRAYQKQGRGRAEAAATKLPFFKKKKFGKSGKKMF